MNVPAGSIKRVLLVEPSASGHHMALYVRYVVRELDKIGVEISLLTTRDAAADTAYQLVEEELPKSAKVHFFDTEPQTITPTAANLFLKQLSNWKRVRDAARKVIATDSPDIIYIPTVDWIAKAIETLGSPFGMLPFVALYMSPKHHRYVTGIGPRSRFDTLYDVLFKRFLKLPTLKKLLVIDEMFCEYGKNRYQDGKDKLDFVPDFAVIEQEVSKEQAREQLKISQHSKVLLVYGSLTFRKGIRELLNALSSKNSPNDVIVLLAGRSSEGIVQLLKQPEFAHLISEGRIITRLHFHDAKGESMVFAAADAVWIAYVQGFYGSSGVLHQAVGYGLPVIAVDQGLIGTLVTKFELGTVLDPKDVDQAVDSLKALSNGNLCLSCSSAEHKKFKEIYSLAGHVEVVTRALGLDGAKICSRI